MNWQSFLYEEVTGQGVFLNFRHCLITNLPVTRHVC